MDKVSCVTVFPGSVTQKLSYCNELQALHSVLLWRVLLYASDKAMRYWSILGLWERYRKKIPGDSPTMGESSGIAYLFPVLGVT